MTSSKDANEHTRVHFFVTGFGPFQNAPENPTTVIANKLLDYLEQSSSGEASTISGLSSNTTIKPMVLEVSVEAVKEALDELEVQLRNDVSVKKSSAATGNNRAGVTVLLHLGVNYKGTGFQLEQCAYNDATFRIPDQRGYQPTKELIIPNMDWGQVVNTTLNLQSIGQKLKQKYKCEILSKAEAEEQAKKNVGEKDTIQIIQSTDPGRYVCNYTYCYSLDKFCSSSGNGQQSVSEQGPRFYSLFLHVPPFEIIGEEVQMKFVAELIGLIEDEVSQ